MVIQLFPTLLALLVAVGMLNASGIINKLSEIVAPILKLFSINKELAPLILLRPISGSTTTAIATDLMSRYGVDSNIGLISACIMGATETTLYTITILFGAVGLKKIRGVLIAGLIADTVAIITAIILVNIGFI